MMEEQTKSFNVSVFWNAMAITLLSALCFVVVFIFNSYQYQHTQSLQETLIDNTKKQLAVEDLGSQVNQLTNYDDFSLAQVEAIFKKSLALSLKMNQSDLTNGLLDLQKDVKTLKGGDPISADEKQSIAQKVQKTFKALRTQLEEVEETYLSALQSAQDALHDAQSRQQKQLMFLIALMGAFVLGAGFWIGRSLSTRLSRLAEQITQLNEGALHEQIHDLNRRDEIGDMARSLNVFKTNALRIQKLHSDLKNSVAANQQAVEMKNQFMVRMGQELRTPLNAIIGQSEKIIESVDGGVDISNLRKEIMKIATSGQHLLGMVDTILELDAAEEAVNLNLEDFNIRDRIQQMLPSLETVILKNHNKFSVTCPDPNLRMTSDGEKLVKVLIQLITNAANFTKTGKIVLDIRASTFGDDPGITLTLTDNGCGIRSENLKKIFQPFTQLDTSPGQKSSGMGLGLTIVQKLVTILGGTIEVESQLNVGSTFRVILPQYLRDDKVISAAVQFAG